MVINRINRGQVVIEKVVGLRLTWADHRYSRPNWSLVKRMAVRVNRFPLVIELPCGCALYLPEEKDLMMLPPEDIPCPCRDPTHWLVEFKDETKETRRR